jgi:hypothetical protein
MGPATVRLAANVCLMVVGGQLRRWKRAYVSRRPNGGGGGREQRACY